MTEETLPLTGLILAGGQSKRMGRDKAGLVLDGETLLARMERLLTDCGVRETVILGHTDHAKGLPDKTPFAGPARALATWLDTQTDRRQIIVVPVDMPGLTPALLKPLIAAGSACYGNFFLPFSAFTPAQPLGDTDRVRDLLHRLAVTRLPVPAGSVAQFANINTPPDLAAFERVGDAENTPSSGN